MQRFNDFGVRLLLCQPVSYKLQIYFQNFLILPLSGLAISIGKEKSPREVRMYYEQLNNNVNYIFCHNFFFNKIRCTSGINCSLFGIVCIYIFIYKNMTDTCKNKMFLNCFKRFMNQTNYLYYWKIKYDFCLY